MSSLLITGVNGRMGRLIARDAHIFGFEIAAGVDSRLAEGFAFPVYRNIKEVKEEAEVLIDFSSPDMLPQLLEYATAKNLPCVLCTTGYTAQEENVIREASGNIAVFRSANMSLGVYVLRRLAKEASRMLPGFDIEIVEKHHNQKVDSPSGTALALYESVKRQESQPVFGRQGQVGMRKPEEIGLHAVRGGTVAGEHEVGFYGPSETLLLTHAAQDRAVFASGALRAAKFLIGKAPGLYGMEELASGL